MNPPRDRKNESVLCLNIGPNRGDVRLRIRHLTEQIASRISPVMGDLLEIAAYIYSADLCQNRGRRDQFDYGEKWRRDFRFRIAMRNPDLWNSPRIQESLRSVLQFLTDDDYQFQFEHSSLHQDWQNRLFEHAPNGSRIEEVMLFSGGLDSLAGAAQEIFSGQRRVALISHEPVSCVGARQEELTQALCSRLPNADRHPLRIGLDVRRGGTATDYTQRSRSFLFSSLAAVVAHSLGLPRLRFYENGITSLNLPHSKQIVGARASRTTHPQSLAGFTRFFSELFGQPFQVENPYLWKTKPEILRDLNNSAAADLVAHTVSCVNTRFSNDSRSHCGFCSQCLDRRISTLAAYTLEPAELYRDDVFLGERSDTDLVFAERFVSKMFDWEECESPRQMASEYGEVMEILPHLGLPHERGLQEIYSLHRRYAQDARDVFTSQIQQQSSRLIRFTYPTRSILSLLVGRCDTVTPRTTASSPAFMVDDKLYRVAYRQQQVVIGAGKAFDLLRCLHQHQSRFVAAQELRDLVWQDQFTDRKTVQRAISRLRAQLKPIAGVEIQSQPRAGYRLVIT